MTTQTRKVLAAAVLGIGSFSFGQTAGTWALDVGTAGGSWSVASNWQDGSIPNNGGTANFVAVPFSTAPLAIFQDLPSVTLDQINYETYITYNLRAPAAAPTNAITLTGDAVINTPLNSINTLATSTFGQLIQMPVAGSAGLTKRGPGTVTLWQNTNTYTGGTRVEDGVLVLRAIGDAGLGNTAGGVSFDGGTLRITNTAWTTNRAVEFKAGGGTIDTTNNGTTTINSNVTGNGVLNKIGGRGLTFTASNDYTGATNLLAGSIGLSGNGALTGTSAITARETLVLDNSGTNVTNRINNAAPITFHGANLALTGNASGSGEALGTMNFSRGTSTITVTNTGTTSNASIVIADVSRELGGTAFIRGTNLGSTPSPGTSHVYFDLGTPLVGGMGAAGSTNIAIIPWVIANNDPTAAITAATTSFATGDIGGVRPLNIATEYATTLAAVGATDNVRLTAADSVTAPKTINSLIVATASPITGSSTLTVTSGAVMNLAATTITPNLEFGAREAIFFAQASLTLNGAISGSGGLTKQGAGAATFAAANTYTGTTVIGGGTAVFNANINSTGAPSPFGTDTSAIILAPAGIGTGGTTARLLANLGLVTFDRDLRVTGRVATGNSATIPGFGVNGATTLVMNGDINLDGSPLSILGNSLNSLVIINGDISGTGPLTDGSSNGGTVRLNGNNTYTGDTELGGGLLWEVGSNSAFGTGLIKVVGAGSARIQAAGGPRTVSNSIVTFSNTSNYWTVAGTEDITFNGDINLSGSYTHNINNTGVTTYAGPLHTGGFTKGGTGVLVLSGSNTYTGLTTISTGVLRVTNGQSLGLASVPTIVNSGAALEIQSALSAEVLTINGTGIGGAGAVRASGGDNSVGDVRVNSPSLISVTSTLATGNVSAAGAGTADLSKSGAGTLTARRYRIEALSVLEGTAGVSASRDVDKTSVVTALNVSSGATFDLGSNDMVINYTAASPLANVQSLIATGYADGSWTGTGITSSAAASQTATALGFAEASDVFTSFPATFSGQSVDDTSVLIRYTIKGDANLDGSANISDFALLAANFNATGSTWYRGDFNYDGTTNISDFALLAANFNLSQPNDLPRGASVPEASSIAILAAVALQGRRRRRA